MSATRTPANAATKPVAIQSLLDRVMEDPTIAALFNVRITVDTLMACPPESSASVHMIDHAIAELKSVREQLAGQPKGKH